MLKKRQGVAGYHVALLLARERESSKNSVRFYFMKKKFLENLNASHRAVTG